MNVRGMHNKGTSDYTQKDRRPNETITVNRRGEAERWDIGNKHILRLFPLYIKHQRTNLIVEPRLT
jgi:hypothetical protein